MNDARKWERLQQATRDDATDPGLRELAERLRRAAGVVGGPWQCYRFATLAHAVARDWVPYQTDTARVGGEDMHGVTRPREPALAVLTRSDDCDSKARLFVALCLAVGLPARLVPLWKGPTLEHVYAEVCCRSPGDHVDRWRPVETILARARLGESAHAVPKELNGRWRYT